MAESLIPVSGTSKNLETSEFTNTAGNIVNREGVFIGDPDTFGNQANVDQIDYNTHGLNVIAHAPEGLGIRDAFSRLRVSNPTTLFDSQSQYNDGTTDKWFHKTTTGASLVHLPAQSSVSMATDTTGGAQAIRQSQRYIRYQPGKSQLILVTFDFAAVDGGTKRAGYFDGENGVFVEMAADGTISFVLRSSASGSLVDTKITQENWSFDAMDGAGPSGITLDMTKAHILVIDLQWLAVGRVRCAFDIDGKIYYCHEFYWANEQSGVYMTTANLPIRYELSGNGSTTQMQAICASVQSEGGYISDLGHEHCTPNGVTAVACASGVETPIVSIRPKALFNSITNRGEYVPDRISFYVTTNPCLMRVYHGSTLTGASWVSADAESGIEYDSSATAFSGGHLVDSEFGAAASGGQGFSTTGGTGASNRIFLTLDIDGNHTDEGNFTVVGVGLGGTANVRANLHWTEVK